ncbi:hypothetical protein [Cutibacterium avidum]|uniref:hypothetical protein n=1 Tax=Cutibacterium avidum TaxID=33010 RepID=UPI00115F7C80|nr:hypothetical protein [Cutibacterium avidum]MDK7699582.1 hypothetical protein [Cutibacterium avidum]
MLDKVLPWLRDGTFDRLYSLLGSFVGVLSVFAIVDHVRPLDILRGWLGALVVPVGWLGRVDAVLAGGTPWGRVGVVVAVVGVLGVATHDVCRGRSGPTFWCGAGLMVTAGMSWLWLILLLAVGFVVSMTDLITASWKEEFSFGDSLIREALGEALWRLWGTLFVTLFYSPLEVVEWLTGEPSGGTRRQIINPAGRPLKVELVEPKPEATKAHRNI